MIDITEEPLQEHEVPKMPSLEEMFLDKRELWLEKYLKNFQ